jgi:hypothetical protein
VVCPVIGCGGGCVAPLAYPYSCIYNTVRGRGDSEWIQMASVGFSTGSERDTDSYTGEDGLGLDGRLQRFMLYSAERYMIQIYG